MRISHFFIDRPIFAAVVSIVFVIVGAVSFMRLPVAQYPEIAPPVINVSGQYPGATADVVAGAADDRAAAAGAPGELERRVEALTEENAELTAGLADAERRRAELEDEHRQEVAALRTEAGRLGEQMATLAADKQALATEKDVLAAERDALAADNDALAAELEAGRLRTAALEEELAARRHADEAALAELRSAHDRLARDIAQGLPRETFIKERA